MTLRQRPTATPPAPKTLDQLLALMPYGPAHVTALSFSGPFQIQTAKVVIANCRDRNVAEYLVRLWNTIAPAVEGGDADKPEVFQTCREHLTTPPSQRTGTGARRRKAGKSVQVVP